ncbi:uncharacterized protein KQ657_001480 [Scheffersomyces spartinae]|uniref:Alcohol dehydrogenase n=1 Tax=Scheffersomyces spartinae TaxID=45513 RepID=A0A9P7V7A8_9ASCO|nr:uncharacterized protein KQ657_001480 [Scheffersomyces spartinae]KAG7192699.1 hypothetical protein KQ657_001480 [Scheffersomyces spartinae]
MKNMKAVVYHGPFDVRVETRPTPKVVHDTDVILKVKYSGLCGTDLHSYRGHIPGPCGTIIGHEFLGEVVGKGNKVSKFKVGDEVLSVFTIQCGECFYCKHGYTGTCVKTNTFGKTGLDGGQAEYVRVPHAENTLLMKPAQTSSSSIVDDSIYVLMADIFVTGYYGAKKILNFLNQEAPQGYRKQTTKDVNLLLVGAGPVGLCALKALQSFGFTNIVVVDSIPSRLQQAESFGAKKVINFEEQPDTLANYVKSDLNGIGFDGVLEAVGANSSLRSAYESVRNNGIISALGMPHDALPFTGLECYVKNINISFGRCHCWAYFAEALAVFEKTKDLFAGFIDHKCAIENAPEAYKLFDEHKVNKVVFDFTT